MSSQEGDLRIVQRISAAEYVRHIDPHASSQEERRKRRHQRQPSQGPESESELPHDIVEIHSPGSDHTSDGFGAMPSPLDGAVPTLRGPKVQPGELATSAKTPDTARHLDLKV